MPAPVEINPFLNRIALSEEVKKQEDMLISALKKLVTSANNIIIKHCSLSSDSSIFRGAVVCNLNTQRYYDICDYGPMIKIEESGEEKRTKPEGDFLTIIPGVIEGENRVRYPAFWEIALPRNPEQINPESVQDLLDIDYQSVEQVVVDLDRAELIEAYED